MALPNQKLASNLSESSIDKPIHDNSFKDLQINGYLDEIQLQQQQQQEQQYCYQQLSQQRKWKVELHDAELYVFCAVERSEICLQQQIDDALIAPSKAAAIVIVQLPFSLSLMVDDGLCWELDANSSVSKETKLDYSITIPPDEHLLLILHQDVGADIITQIDKLMKAVCGKVQ
eukprot:TRINITY_DN16337_c0_g1_i1.p2 TRINITY_DN16337_c0_g1~~TRINITY_DN16337_c0_g1_i1.p2  ORF type:complete len:174 (-),score=14.07 TRINITY_DN16337_c0_g1_i1:41-562(-)